MKTTSHTIGVTDFLAGPGLAGMVQFDDINIAVISPLIPDTRGGQIATFVIVQVLEKFPQAFWFWAGCHMITQCIVLDVSLLKGRYIHIERSSNSLARRHTITQEMYLLIREDKPSLG
jgi:hypothetical protein